MPRPGAGSVAGDGAAVCSHRRDARGDVPLGHLLQPQPVQRPGVQVQVALYLGEGPRAHLGLLVPKVERRGRLECLTGLGPCLRFLACWVTAKPNLCVKVLGSVPRLAEVERRDRPQREAPLLSAGLVLENECLRPAGAKPDAEAGHVVVEHDDFGSIAPEVELANLCRREPHRPPLLSAILPVSGGTLGRPWEDFERSFLSRHARRDCRCRLSYARNSREIDTSCPSVSCRV